MKFLLLFVIIIGIISLAYVAADPPVIGTKTYVAYRDRAYPTSTQSSSNTPIRPTPPPPKTSQPKPPPPPRQAPPPPSSNSKPVPPAGYQPDDLSPFYRRVDLQAFPRTFSGGAPSLRLFARIARSAAPISITGWTVRSNRDQFTIPTGASMLYPGNFAIPGDIQLSYGQFAHIYLAGSDSYNPIRYNFRLNMCTGFLNTYGFRPALPKSCPRPVRSSYDHLSAACQDYIRTLSTCSVPSSMPTHIQTDYDCRAYLEEFTGYSACFEENKNEANFLSDEWRIYIHRADVFDRNHDKILLLDRDGLLVDLYTY